ncbi:MAG: SUMF1/EgtB/PvdO family nonheme iron enzyme [Verrucomicrobiota bacterium]
MEELGNDSTWIANRYECLEELGEGSTGKVWLTQDHVRNETVALRWIDEEIIDEVGGFDVAAKWLTTTTNFRHPSVVTVFDFAPHAGGAYISMQRQKGQVLRERIKQAKADPSKQFTEETILEIVETISQVLQAGVQTGWAHAGIKPENIWLSKDGTVSLSEYGLHHLLSPDSLKSSAALLRTGQYLPPEMYELDAKPDFKTDQFALGTLWTELIQCSQLKDHSDSFQTHRSIIQRLTETSSADRFEDLPALMHALKGVREKLTSKRTITSSKSIKQLFHKKAWTRGLVWAPLLLLLIPLWQELSYETSVVIPETTTRTDLQRMTRELEAERVQLFKDGFQHAALHPHLQNLFGHIYPIDTMLELGALSGNKLQVQMNQLQTELESERIRITKGQRWVRLFSQTGTWIHHIDQSTTTRKEERDAWIAHLAKSQTATLASAKTGQLDTAIQQLDESLSTLQSELISLLAAEKKVAAEKRDDWAHALKVRGTPYAEPQENLTAALEQLENPGTGPEVVDKIVEARRIQEQFTFWTNDWEALPKEPPQGFQNSLGMFFVQVGNMRVSIWETRVIDFYHFITSSGFDENRSWREEAALNTPAHPVSTITRYGAVKFCEWLTEKERSMGLLPEDAYYSLPTDEEWSQLAGLPHETGEWPEERHFNAPDLLPWDGNSNDFSNYGNYYTLSSADASNQYFGKIDRFDRTAPVGQFKANGHGLYDVGGNVMEWVSSEYRFQPPPNRTQHYTLRGGGWRTLHPEQMRVGYRVNPPAGLVESGFRCVIKNWPKDLK